MSGRPTFKLTRRYGAQRNSGQVQRLVDFFLSLKMSQTSHGGSII
jgi:hypothetical protein